MYFKTPTHSVAFNAKVASSTLARAIIREFWPEQEALIQTAAYPAGRGPDTIQAHFLCPHESSPSKPVVLVVRDPVERFRSAMAYMRLTDVDATLLAIEQSSPEQGTPADNPHFRHQHLFARPSARVFRLDDLYAAAAYLGLTPPLPLTNESPNEKPSLTPEQEARVLAYYAEDKALHDSVLSGGIDYVVTSEPEFDPVPQVISASQFRLWLVRNGISMAQVSASIGNIADPQVRAEAEVLWEYSTQIERSGSLAAIVAAEFDMDAAALDQAFREAGQL